jgi:hypothetical protein
VLLVTTITGVSRLIWRFWAKIVCGTWFCKPVVVGSNPTVGFLSPVGYKTHIWVQSQQIDSKCKRFQSR